MGIAGFALTVRAAQRPSELNASEMTVSAVDGTVAISLQRGGPDPTPHTHLVLLLSTPEEVDALIAAATVAKAYMLAGKAGGR